MLHGDDKNILLNRDDKKISFDEVIPMPCGPIYAKVIFVVDIY